MTQTLNLYRTGLRCVAGERRSRFFEDAGLVLAQRMVGLRELARRYKAVRAELSETRKTVEILAADKQRLWERCKSYQMERYDASAELERKLQSTIADAALVVADRNKLHAELDACAARLEAAENLLAAIAHCERMEMRCRIDWHEQWQAAKVATGTARAAWAALRVPGVKRALTGEEDPNHA